MRKGQLVSSCRFFLLEMLLIGLIVSSLFTLAAASEQQIHNPEFLTPLQTDEVARTMRVEADGQRVPDWIFEAHGKTFELELTSNEKLVSALPQRQREALLKHNVFLRGQLLNNDDSWVRISETAHGISGMIWDGEQHYVIESARRVEAQLSMDQPMADDDNRLVIYRRDEQLHVPLTCGVDHHIKGKTPNEDEALIPGMASPTKDIAMVGANGDLKVIVVEDQHWGGDTLAIFNAVDGIYNSHFGVSITISSTEKATLNPSSSGDLLRTFRQYIGNRSSIGLAHLMTGRRDTGWAGVAYVNKLCEGGYGTGVSTNQGYHNTVEVVAHEMGHNASAQHDHEVGCGDSWIMNWRINGSHEFSSCSEKAIRPALAAASCVAINSNNPKASMLSPAPGTTLDSTVVTFTWNRPSGANSYDLTVGTTGAGSTDIRSSSPTSGTSVTVRNLPDDGSTIYVRLWTSGNTWAYNDYTYISGSDNAPTGLTIIQ